jgi:putative membrane protein
MLDPPWLGPLDAAFAAAAVLGIGAAAALLTTFVPPFARLFLPAARLEVEVDQYARALFLEREVFRTRHRTGVLVFVSLFERRVVVLPDAGLAARLGDGAMRDVVDRMTPLLARGARCRALVEGLAALEDVLRRAGPAGALGGPDEIEDELVQGKGADE